MVRLLVDATPDRVTLQQHMPHATDVLRIADIKSLAHVLTHNEFAGI